MQADRLPPRGNRTSLRGSTSAAAPAPQGEFDAQVEIAARELHRKKGTRGVFFFLLLVVPIAVGGYFLFGRWKAQRNRDIKKYLTEATEQLRHDSYSSYQKASGAADKVLEMDPTSTAAHGYLAYAYAVRWGEHGGGENARRLAEEHLAAAKKGGEISSHLYAADALILAHLGKSPQAAADLERQIKQFDAQGRASPLMYLTLGLIQSNASDFEHARESLEKAQSLAPDDPRVYAALATLYRRRGQDSEAVKNFDSALRYERDHPESLLGKALLILQLDRPDYGAATKLLKKLLDADPPPSPRQLATAYLARALLISRVSKEMPDYKQEYQKQLSEMTLVPIDKAKARAEVIKAEETGFTLDRQNPDLHLIKGDRLLLEGNVDGAVAEMRQAVKTDPTRSLFYIELAKALLQKPGGDKEAQDALSTAIRTIGENPRLMLMLGNVYRRQGKVEEALAQYDRAIKDRSTKNPEARLAMGTLFREKKDWTKAQEALEKASQEFVGQSGKLAVTYTELGRVYEEKGDRTKADDAYQRALNSDAEYAPAYFFYARFLAGDSRQSSKARATAQEYLKREPRGDFASEAQRLAL
jgi:tetratricopeptide (TPR) repeat protein